MTVFIFSPPLSKGVYARFAKEGKTKPHIGPRGHCFYYASCFRLSSFCIASTFAFGVALT
jgi:hypothetical protein